MQGYLSCQWLRHPPAAETAGTPGTNGTGATGPAGALCTIMQCEGLPGQPAHDTSSRVATSSQEPLCTRASRRHLLLQVQVPLDRMACQGRQACPAQAEEHQEPQVRLFDCMQRSVGSPERNMLHLQLPASSLNTAVLLLMQVPLDRLARQAQRDPQVHGRAPPATPSPAVLPCRATRVSVRPHNRLTVPCSRAGTSSGGTGITGPAGTHCRPIVGAQGDGSRPGSMGHQQCLQHGCLQQSGCS